MSFTTLVVPKEYGYVVIATAGTFFLGLWHGFRVPAYRKPAEAHYPKPYADSYDIANASAEKKHHLYLFNCAQRAHANYLENLPSVIAGALLAGLMFPVSSAVLTAVWMVFRVVYAVGYTSKTQEKGKGRLAGSAFWLCQLGLYGLTVYSGFGQDGRDDSDIDTDVTACEVSNDGSSVTPRLRWKIQRSTITPQRDEQSNHITGMNAFSLCRDAAQQYNKIQIGSPKQPNEMERPGISLVLKKVEAWTNPMSVPALDEKHQ
ncbi:Hypothetical protein R9X50_00422400 [Acrodontium crateriforme]|uniref:Microsomal glutathione S-transferase 3 n=1 Tax=Acrodontium crateriforme TaxID=150365 RepID=A0AAQ3R873_9PEZI|nr:Hypothetical protein R9X50_00422400 [Acrodontium crateriforme]